MVSEYVDQARFEEDAYVIRAEPTGVPTGVGSLSLWVELALRVRRFIRRDQTWTVRVRRSEDDPFGDVLHQEVMSHESHARRRAEEIKDEIRSGQFSSEPR